MIFGEDDNGPSWMKDDERLKQKYNIPTGKVRERKYTKGESIALLSNTGFEVPPGTNLKTVLEKCKDQNISTKAPPEPLIQDGWCGKTKGLNQVLWERGFIKEGKRYTVSTDKYEFGVFNYDRSLKYLLANCIDFAEVDSLL